MFHSLPALINLVILSK